MAITVQAHNPEQLLDSIYAGIDRGHVKTWMYDQDKDFTHEPEQWRYHLWLRPRAFPQQGILRLNTIAPKNIHISTEEYAIFHGRFIEMLLAHFDKLFETAQATAQATPQDRLTGT